MSYPLHHNALRGTSQLSEACVTLLALGATKLHLDELVVRQRALVSAMTAGVTPC